MSYTMVNYAKDITSFLCERNEKLGSLGPIGVWVPPSLDQFVSKVYDLSAQRLSAKEAEVVLGLTASPRFRDIVMNGCMMHTHVTLAITVVHELGHVLCRHPDYMAMAYVQTILENTDHNSAWVRACNELGLFLTEQNAYNSTEARKDENSMSRFLSPWLYDYVATLPKVEDMA